MELRTRFLPKLMNDEVEEYLEHNDIIIVPVGTVEMHGGLPLDSETVVSEATALKMAEACDGLVLPNLPYFYAGATALGRGTTQVSVRQGIDYLGAIARSLLRQGFTRQVYISMHGPAHMTICPMVRDFYDETGVPILYMDMTMTLMKMGEQMAPKNPEASGGMGMDFLAMFDSMIIGAYDILGRIEDVPLDTSHHILKPQSTAAFGDLFGAAYQSGSMGYYFGEKTDHMATSELPDAETRQAFADKGKGIIDAMVQVMDMPHVVEQMKDVRAFEDKVNAEHPWTPAAWNNR